LDPSSAPWRSFDAPTIPAPATAQAPQARSNLLLGAGAALLVALIAGAVLLNSASTVDPSLVVDVASASDAGSNQAAPTLIVDIGGAVAEPGVYRLPAGSRVGDAITAAGGYGPRVDARRVGLEINLAAPLKDGEHLIVPSRDDDLAGSDGVNAAEGASTASGSSAAGGLLNLNTASAGQLDTLPGVGPVTAAKIIAARETAPFASVRDLRDRKLVSQKTFDGLSALVTVR
jgi:competence protein ComEA